jgi:hypothetical protein
MRTPASSLPDLQALARGLTSVLGGSGAAKGPVAVVNRQPCGQGTFPKEVVTCRCGDGSELRLFCKYGSDETNHNCHGHRGGVAYEAAVYSQILQRSRATTPKYYGTYIAEWDCDTWLILDYMANAVRLTRAADPGAMNSAAAWIGRFHADHELGAASAARPSLHTYDANYYQGWARRTNEFAGALHRDFGWLATLCRRFEEVVPLLMAATQTVIHGEYYPAKNILYADGIVCPVDWESAAIAAGEIDVAALTEGWPAGAARECEYQYQRNRWPEGAPSDFERTLGAARLYLAFRWLGEDPGQTTHERNLCRFDDLWAVGERLGLI